MKFPPSTTRTRLQRANSDHGAMLGLGGSGYREAECSSFECYTYRAVGMWPQHLSKVWFLDHPFHFSISSRAGLSRPSVIHCFRSFLDSVIVIGI